MNVQSPTLAVRSASTCLAATSVTVWRATRLTPRARHARLNQVTFQGKSVRTQYLRNIDRLHPLQIWITVFSFLLYVLQALCPHCTSPTDMRWGRWQWTGESMNVWSRSWKMWWLWTLTCKTKWSSGLTCFWRKSTGKKHFWSVSGWFSRKLSTKTCAVLESLYQQCCNAWNKD